MRMLVDSGYRPEMVYAFALKHPSRVLACKGHDYRDAPISASKIQVDIKGRTIKGGLQLWHHNAGFFKGWLHGKIRQEFSDSGGWYLSQDTTDDFCKQIVAESMVTKPNGKILWVKGPHDNHYLDAAVLNAAAAYTLNLNLRRRTYAVKGRKVRSGGIQ